MELKFPIKLIKPRARTYILFEVDLYMDEDGWFIKESTIERKTNKTKYTACLIRKDIPHILKSYQNRGWIVDK